MPTSLIGLEACSGAHFLGRALRKQGHDVRLIAAQFVKPFVKSNKNDFVDAEAIAEAVERKNMRFVPIKRCVGFRRVVGLFAVHFRASLERYAQDRLASSRPGLSSGSEAGVGAGCSCHPTGANDHRSPPVPLHPVWQTPVTRLWGVISYKLVYGQRWLTGPSAKSLFRTN